MYIHIGDDIVVSGNRIMGIFNAETILLSDMNARYFDRIGPGDKTIVIDRSDNSITSRVSSFTILNRTELKGNTVWRRKA